MPFLQPMLDTPFGEIAAILLIAAVVGVIGALMRQPLIVAFIAVGILVGPSALHLVRHAEELELLASIGIAVLLFLVGLRLDVSVIRTMGPVSLATGLGQVGFTSIIGFFLCLLLGMSVAASVYVAVALTFSSTIIIVKLLSD
ncbi:MAG: cation:proton antiporter, partial [Phycisphaerales bacterium]|nr:cation:proton antiporter [Phycisphaerales bacterium]